MKLNKDICRACLKGRFNWDWDDDYEEELQSWKECPMKGLEYFGEEYRCKYTLEHAVTGKEDETK